MILSEAEVQRFYERVSMYAISMGVDAHNAQAFCESHEELRRERDRLKETGRRFKRLDNGNIELHGEWTMKELIAIVEAASGKAGG